LEKTAREKAIDGKEASVLLNLNKEREVTVPRGGGIIIWVSMIIVLVLIFILNSFFDVWWLEKLNFLSREQTWIPLLP